jgi:hypothetical protein
MSTRWRLRPLDAVDGDALPSGVVDMNSTRAGADLPLV